MSKIELPELPQPDAYTTQIKEGRVIFEPRISLNARGLVGVYGAPKLRARDRQIVELCASLAEAMRPAGGRAWSAKRHACFGMCDSCDCHLHPREAMAMRAAQRSPAPCPSYGPCTYPDCGHFLDVRAASVSHPQAKDKP